MSFKPVKLQSENARLRDEIRNLQRALKDISKDVVISNSPSPISSNQGNPKPKPKFLLDESYQSSAASNRQRSPLFKQWTPTSKKENTDPYTYVASFGVLGASKGKPKLTTTKHTDFELIGVSPTFRDCGSPASELTSERSSDHRESATMADTKFDSDADIEFFPSISRVVETKSGISLSSSLSSDLHRIEDSRERQREKKEEAQVVKQSVKDTFSSFYDQDESVEEVYRNQSIVSIEADPIPLLAKPASVLRSSTMSSTQEVSKTDPCNTSLIKTIEALREENRLLRTKIGQGGKKPKNRRRSKSPNLGRKSPCLMPSNSGLISDSQLLKPASPFKKTTTPIKARGRQFSRPRTSRNPASTSRQGTARTYTSRSAERNKSAIFRVRHCDTCDHLLSKGFSTVYCSKHGSKQKNDRSSSIDLLTQRSFEAIKERNAV
mmetsp:Transcript_16665/g.29965  ORF Transcript_16665/g.29965 Transcript_16665/m.29965 type:complete len:437 (+) Transcript_16665:101-1411(+)